MKNNKWWQSSDRSGNLSTTIKGLLALVLPVVIFWGQTQGWAWSEEELSNLVQVTLSVLGGVITIYGLVKKLLNARQ